MSELIYYQHGRRTFVKKHRYHKVSNLLPNRVFKNEPPDDSHWTPSRTTPQECETSSKGLGNQIKKQIKGGWHQILETVLVCDRADQVWVTTSSWKTCWLEYAWSELGIRFEYDWNKLGACLSYACQMLLICLLHACSMLLIPCALNQALTRQAEKPRKSTGRLTNA